MVIAAGKTETSPQAGLGSRRGRRREKKVHMGQLNDGKGLRELNLMIPLQIPDQ